MNQISGICVSLVAIWATDINTDSSSSGRTMDPDMILGRSLGLDIMVVPGWQCRPAGLAWLQGQCGTGTKTWPQVVAQTPGISMAFDCNRSYRHQLRPGL